MSYNKIDMAKRKQKAKRVVKTKSSSQRMQNISKININIGKEFKQAMMREKREKKRNDQVSLAPVSYSTTTYLPTTPQTTTLLEAPNRQYANVPEPLRRNVYASLPAVSNPVKTAPVVNGSSRDPQPQMNAPIIIDTNKNDLAPRQVSYTEIKPSPRNMIPNLSVSSISSLSSAPPSYRSAPSTPLKVPPVSLLAPRQHSFSSLDLIERNPTEARPPIDIGQSMFLSSLPSSASSKPRKPIGKPTYEAQPYQSPSDRGRGRPTQQELKDKSKYYEDEYMKMLASIPK